jgi:putative transposase
MSNPFRYFNSSPEVIRLVVMMYVRYPLSLRNVEDLLAERGIDISHETVRFWWNRFGPMFAAEIRKRRVAHMRGFIQWRWHLDEAFVKINGKLCYLWRAVDHEGEVLEAVVTSKRSKAAALKLLKRIMKKYGRPRTIVTDRLRAYSAVMKEIGVADRHEVGRRLNNRAENSISRFDDGSGRCSDFGVRRRCRNSVQFTPRSTIISTRSGISSPGRFTSRDARLHWRSGAPLARRASLSSVRVALRVAESRYFDDAHRCHAGSRGDIIDGWQNRIVDCLEGLRNERRTNRPSGRASAERDHPPSQTARDGRNRQQIA